jgi:hypothetical protein
MACVALLVLCGVVGCQSNRGSHHAGAAENESGLLAVGDGSPYVGYQGDGRDFEAGDFAAMEGLAQPELNRDVGAQVVPPIGWKPDPIKKSPKHTHQAWISPSGRTAYGVISFQHMLLFLASDKKLIDETLKAMKKTEGEAILLGQQKDPNLNAGAGGLRFEAEGGLYRLKSNLLRAGSRGWIVYAGTLRDQPVEPEELELAERARERTRVGSEHAKLREHPVD